MKLKLLRQRALGLLMFLSCTQSVLANLTEDFGYLFLGTSFYSYETAEYSYEGWILQGDGSVITPELDLTDCTNPYIVYWTQTNHPIWISSDGVTFTKIADGDNSYVSYKSIPRDTRYIKMQDAPKRCSVIVSDLANGPIMSEELTPTILNGTQNANGTYYCEDYEAIFSINVPKPSIDKTIRFIQFSSGSSHPYILSIKCESGKVLTQELEFNFDQGRRILLPKDVESVEVCADVYNKVFNFKANIIDFAINTSNVWRTPSEDLKSYYDIDGDGLLDNRNIHPVNLYDGTWQFLYSENNWPTEVLGLNSGGNLYGLNGREFLKIDKAGNHTPICELPENKGYGYTLTGFDYNFDGQSEFYAHTHYTLETPLLTLKPDGTAFTTALSTMTPNEYNGVRGELQLSTGGNGVPGMGDMFGRDDTGVSFRPSTTVDINSDGLPDLLDETNGIYLLNLGDGSFINSSFGNRVLVRDLDGDGINDILIWEYAEGNLKLFNGADTTKDPIVLFNNLYIGYVYCCDVDNDGDIDVVALINADSRAKESYVLISENLGQNKFRRRENFIEEKLNWCDYPPFDLDADGKYELIGEAAYPNPPYMVKIISPTEVSVEKISESRESPFPIKASSDGSWMIYQRYGKTAVKAFAAGNRPAKPGIPNLHFDANTRRLTVSWEPGSDSETPSSDLTYELRVGTTPGGNEIVAAQALDNGTRRALRKGANGYSTFALFNVDNWPEGKIYISVQTVDADYTGSQFSEPAVFEKTSPACDFIFPSGNEFTNWEPFNVEPAFNSKQGASYQWNFADAEILDINPDTNKATIRYTTPAAKQISLKCTSHGGIETSVTKTINVSPFAIKYSSQTSSGALDIDGDGVAELFDYDKFYKETADGTFESYKKSFNTSTGISSFNVADINGDGIADVFDRNNRLINYGDGDMERESTESLGTYGTWTLYDFNNDGKIDQYQKLNSGDYLIALDAQWNLTPRPATYAWYGTSRIFFYDFNRDGLIDLAYIAGESDPDDFLFDKRLPLHILENIDGYSFKPGQMIADITKEPAMIDDLDGDGLPEYVFCDASYNFGVTSYVEFIVIKWGTGFTTKIQCPDENPFRGINCAFDYNNDGMKDLAVSLQDSNKKGGIALIDPSTHAGNIITFNEDAYLPHARLRDGKQKFSFGTISVLPNECPTPPSSIRATQNESGVVIEWEAGSDKETPVKGLRYNISVKRKGIDGEGAYIISPLNGGDASIPLPQPIYLPATTKFTIPSLSIPAGEYEVSIQTVDWQNDVSQFSEVYNLVVRPHAIVKAPTSGIVNQPIEISLLSASPIDNVSMSGNPSITHTKNNVWIASWESEGLKEIMVNNERVGEIYIYPPVDASFKIAADVFAGAHVNITDIHSQSGTWEYSLNGAEFKPMYNNDEAVIVKEADTNLGIRFLKAGSFQVRHTITESYGEASQTQNVSVVDFPIEIVASVTDDYSHFKVKWNVAAAPADAQMVHIYKETSVYNQYLLIGKEDVISGEFVDMDSNPAIKTDRYKILFEMPYGETALSEAHQPLHVQINQGVGSAINLSWSHYEGLDVTSYNVLKGKNPHAMTTYETLSGRMNSFTDIAEDAAECCYSIEAVAYNPTVNRSNSRETEVSSRSNLVWGHEAFPSILVSSVVLSPISGTTQFDGRNQISLQARTIPSNATIQRFNWEVIDGAENMEVDIYGNVTAKEFGKATVRATAIDGSGAYGQIELTNNEILLTNMEFTSWPDNHTICLGDTFQYEIKTEPANATEKPVWASSVPSVATISQDGMVESVGYGETMISVSGRGENMFINLYLTVAPPEGFVRVESFWVEPYYIGGVVGDEVQLIAQIRPENATLQRVLWSVEPGSEKVITVDENGKVTIIGEGDARVRATLESNPIMTLVVEIHAVSGIESVCVDPEGRWDVCTLDGILLFKDATKEEIRKLSPGIYIIGGRKVFISDK